MKTLPALVLAAVLGVGLLAGVTSYQLASAPDRAASPTTTVPTATPATRADRPRARVRWAPCRPPAVRRGKVCVTEEVRTVVVPAPVAPVAPAAPAAPAAPVAQPVRTGGDDRGEHADGDRGSKPEHEAEHEAENEHETEDD